VAHKLTCDRRAVALLPPLGQFNHRIEKRLFDLL